MEEYTNLASWLAKAKSMGHYGIFPVSLYNVDSLIGWFPSYKELENLASEKILESEIIRAELDINPIDGNDYFKVVINIGR